jgi:hypothetical protein
VKVADYYYQIKAKEKSEYGFSNWAFPPLFSGMVTADSKKSAKTEIENEYGRKFPLRVLEKDLANEHFLLKIDEIKDDDKRTKSLFEFQDCKQCGKGFRRIDLYNDHNEIYKGTEFCGNHCKELNYQQNRSERIDGWSGREQPVIYMIKNKNTGLPYIGKTTQVFTLRWYQHFYHGGTCKFHLAIKDSCVSDWEFSIVEVIDEIPDGLKKDDFISERERHWITQFNSIENGYNSK